MPKIWALKRGVVFQEAYQAYIKDRGVFDISEVAFERLLKVYPSLLVISSDGFVDLTEVGAMASSASEGTSIPPEIFARELKNLYFNQGHWKHIFTRAIKEITEEEENSRLEILTYMIHAAAASTGSVVKNILLSDDKPQSFSLYDIQSLEEIDPTRQFFSEQEKQKIIQVAEELQLLRNQEIRNKVYQLFQK